MPERPRLSTLTMTIILTYLPNLSWSWKKNLSSKNINLPPTMELTPPKLQQNLSRLLIEAIWYNTVKALDSDMKLHDGILDWHSKSVQDIIDSINIKC